MMKKEVIFVLVSPFADWEGAFLAAALEGGVEPGRATGYTVRTLTPDGLPARSIGGMRVAADYAPWSLPADFAGLVLIGGLGWDTPAAECIAPLAVRAAERSVPLGAICNASLFLGRHGLLNSVRHTSNTLPLLQQWGGEAYTGSALYEERQAVRDGAIVTANGTGYLEFCREMLLLLEAAPAERIDCSYRFNKEGFCKP